MSTPKVQFISSSEIIWLPRFNFGKHMSQFDTPEQRRAHAVMLKDGWWADQSVKVVELTDDEKTEAMEYLNGKWKALEEMLGDAQIPYPTTPETKLNAAQLREAFKARWFKGDKISISKLKYGGVYAFQRGDAIDEANALRKAAGLGIVEDIPVIIMHYTGLKDRVADCMNENFGKVAGFKDVTNHWPTIMRGAKAHYVASSFTSTLSEITRLVTGGDTGATKVGRGQKAFALLVLDGKYPDLGIIDGKICSGAFGEADGKKDVDLGQRYAEALDRKKLGEMEKGTRVNAETKIDDETIAEYFADPFKKVTKPRPMTMTALESHGSKTPCLMVKYLAWCITNGKVEMLAAIAQNKELCTKLNEIAVSYDLMIPAPPQGSTGE